MDSSESIPLPYVKGMTLWVRETWMECVNCGTPNYRATVNKPRQCSGCDESLGRWIPSLHMSRWASRITLEISDVRVERLQEISEEDAKAEGVAIKTDAKIAAEFLKLKGDNTWGPAKLEFWHLWESLYGKGAWEKNPWLWVLSFRRIKP